MCEWTVKSRMLRVRLVASPWFIPGWLYVGLLRCVGAFLYVMAWSSSYFLLAPTYRSLFIVARPSLSFLGVGALFAIVNGWWPISFSCELNFVFVLYLLLRQPASH